MYKNEPIVSEQSYSIRGKQINLVPKEEQATADISPLKKEPNYNFLKYDQDQQFLIPISMRDWVREDSFTRFLDAAVNTLDRCGKLDPVYADYRIDGRGGKAYHPQLMVKIILYGFCNGVLSARKLSRVLECNVDLRYLSGNRLPNFRTISDFRIRHNEALNDLFVDILELCKEAGLVRAGRIAIDGRKMKANASLAKNFTRKGLAKKIKKMLEEAKIIDEAEDQQFGPTKRGDELPDDLRTEENQRKVIEEAMKRLADARREEEEKKKNRRKQKKEADGQPLDDDEPPVMKERDEGQSRSDDEEQRPDRHDLDKLERMLDAYDQAGRKEREDRAKQQEMIDEREREEAETGKKKRGRKPNKPEDISYPDKKGNTTDPDSRIMKDGRGHSVQAFNCQAAVSTEGNQQIITACDVTQEENDFHQMMPMMDIYHNNMGEMPKQNSLDAGYWTDAEGALFINGCEMFINTTKDWKVFEALRENGPPRGRIPKNLSNRELMERKMMTKRGRKIYKSRFNSEAVFGQQVTRGIVRFLRRGVEKVTTDWSMICYTGNLMKLYNSGNWSISGSYLKIEPAAE